ncbi:MAG: ATP synthase F1 subunit delta [Candidatus Neomarinimicrobiota bacterium]|jgi:F-type H+-transporting ATPase subunit delta|nr:ATP synthase F1 subunit delta [Candidatus Neomarinimicrobiota bacterium]
MKQNHKKIKLYSDSFSSLVTNFDEFGSIKNALTVLVSVIKKDSTVNAFVRSKSTNVDKKISVFQSALGEVFDHRLLDIVTIMLENDDIALLEDVTKRFLSITKNRLNIAHVEVVSSFDMDEEYQSNLLKQLKEATNKEIDFNFSVDKDLIGGLKIKIDDTLFDSTLKTKLENAKLKLIGV